MIGFDLVPGDGNEKATFVNDFMFGCRRRGVHLTYGFGGVNFRIIPPLVITDSEIDFALRVVEESLVDVLAGTKAPRSDWPRNPQTAGLFKRSPWRRMVNHLWQSSPSDWVEKGKELIQERIGKANG